MRGRGGVEQKGEGKKEAGRGGERRREEDKTAEEGVCTPEVVNQVIAFSRSAATMHLC